MSTPYKITGLAPEDRLSIMGIERWTVRDKNTPSKPDTLTELTGDTATQWAQLRARIEQCQDCALGQSRTQTVFGVGDPNANILFVGEAPGFYEDKQGEPFVGRAGQLLNAMLASIGLARPEVFIANVLKCRPPNNRDPTATEVQACTGYLRAQIQLIEPKVIVALGRVAAHFLLQTDTPLSRLRGQALTYGEPARPLWVTYHPAYLLRNPSDKGKAWQDWQQIARYML